MTGYPNREHENADKAARRRALAALDTITSEAETLQRALRLQSTLPGPGRRADADDTQVMSAAVQGLTGFLAELGTLYDVRQWHAADVAGQRKD